MWKLFVSYWLVAMVIAGPAAESNSTRIIRGPKANKCRLSPVLRTFPSQLYPNNCKVTVNTFTCTGFCRSGTKLIKYNHDTEHRMVLKQDCNCCSTSHNSIVTFKVENYSLDCTDEVYRTETVILHTPTSCRCTQCGRNLFSRFRVN